MTVQTNFHAKHLHGDVYIITLSNDHGIKVNILNYGGIIWKIMVPDRDDKLGNIVLGYDTIEDYYNNPFYLGCIVGRCANRIKDGKLTIANETYQLPINQPLSNNHIHGGFNGFNKKIWNIEDTFSDENTATVVLSYLSPDMEEGYPGNLKISVTYILTSTNELIVEYGATTDKDTLVNLTNHSYFNLSGEDKDVSDHYLYINADYYTPANAKHLPTGEIKAVEGSIYDLRTEKQIDKFMNDIPNINYCLDARKYPEEISVLTDYTTGRRLALSCTNPGLQLYCGNYLSGSFVPFSGICLEPQHYPDSPNHANFPDAILKKGDIYKQTSRYSFIVVEGVDQQ